MSDYSQDDLAALRAAYAAGVTRVRFDDGRLIDYPSASDLLSRIRIIERSLAPTPRRKAGFASFSRGTTC